MRRPAAFLTAFALVVAAMPAAAQNAATDPPPPKALDHSSVLEWSAEYIDFGTYEDAAENDGALLLYDPYSVAVSPSEVTVRVRGELFRPEGQKSGTLRSFRDTWAFDCIGRRIRVLESESFPLSNLQGQSRRGDIAKEKWGKPVGVESDLLAQVCSVATIVRAGVDLATAEPPRLDVLSEPEMSAWFERHVQPMGYRLAAIGSGAGVYYSMEDVGRSKAGRPLVWLRGEFSRLLPTPFSAWRSMRERIEIDCEGMRYRDIVQEDIYPGQNLTGAPIKPPGKPPGWERVEAGEFSGRWLIAVCAGLGVGQAISTR